MIIEIESGESIEEEGTYGPDGVFGGGRHRYLSAVITLSRRTHAAEFRERWTAEHRTEFASIEDRRGRATAAATAALGDARDANAEGHFPGHYFAVRVVATLAATTGEALSVPLDLFDADQDEYWSIEAETGRLVRLR